MCRRRLPMSTRWRPISVFSRRRRSKRASGASSTGTGSFIASLDGSAQDSCQGIRRTGLIVTPIAPIAAIPPPAAGASRGRKLLFLVTEDWYFVSHRLELAIAARQAGYDVAVATRVDRHGDRISDAGL